MSMRHSTRTVVLNSKKLLLDSISTLPSGAYSLKKIRQNYQMESLSLRRLSDNLTSNVFFTEEQLDTTSILSFVGESDGFLRRWNDQSLNARHLTENTNANQPRIVNTGVLETIDGLPAIQFLGGSQKLSNSTNYGISVVSGYTIICSMNLSATTHTGIFLRIGGINDGFVNYMTSQRKIRILYNNIGGIDSTNALPSGKNIIAIRANSINHTFWVGLNKDIINTPIPNFNAPSLVSDVGIGFDRKMSDMLIFNSSLPDSEIEFLIGSL